MRLNRWHTVPHFDIQFQWKPAQISTAGQHLNSGLSQLFDHCGPLEWSWFLINGIHTFVKRRKWKKWSKGGQKEREKRDNLIPHSPPETFSPRTRLSDTKRLLSGVNRVFLRSRGRTTGNRPRFLTHTHTLADTHVHTHWLTVWDTQQCL